MNKTEEPTPKRKREAREQGQVARSAEFTGVAVVVTALGVLVFWMQTIVRSFLATVHQAVELASRPEVGGEELRAFVMHALGEVGWLLFPLLGLTALAAGFVSFVQVGPIWTLEPLMPDADKLNPVNGLTKMVGKERLVELVKHVGKLTVMGVIAVWVVAAWLPDVMAMGRIGLVDSMALLRGAVSALAAALAGGLLAFGLIDLVWQRHQHHESLKMTKREVEDEHKASEGDPEMAGKRKQVHREMIEEAGRPEDVRNADAVVVNPTHVAVGLSYVPGEMSAPEVVASGRGIRARAIKRAARKYQVPIIHHVQLARSLFRDGDLHEVIPPEYYEPVAEILKFAYAMGRDRGRSDAEAKERS